MTSASELFYNRRSRIGRNDTELGLDSSSSSLDRNLPLHLHHNRRRSRHHQRREIEDCDPIRRSSNPRHHCHREHESVRLDHGASQFSTENSSSRGTSSSRANRPQFVRTEQLPGAVLLARERLVERLRGVSLTGNSVRQSSRVTSSIIWDDATYNDDFRLVEGGDWETENSTDWLARDAPSFSDSSAQTEMLSSMPEFSMKRPPGLSQVEVNCLHREIFTIKEKDDELVLEAKECTICLDSFHEGAELICLPCGHRFHSVCLDPWVRTCGDCPNCRAGVVPIHERTGKRK